MSGITNLLRTKPREFNRYLKENITAALKTNDSLLDRIEQCKKETLEKLTAEKNSYLGNKETLRIYEDRYLRLKECGQRLEAEAVRKLRVETRILNGDANFSEVIEEVMESIRLQTLGHPDLNHQSSIVLIIISKLLGAIHQKNPNLSTESPDISQLEASIRVLKDSGFFIPDNFLEYLTLVYFSCLNGKIRQVVKDQTIVKNPLVARRVLPSLPAEELNEIEDSDPEFFSAWGSETDEPVRLADLDGFEETAPSQQATTIPSEIPTESSKTDEPVPLTDLDGSEEKTPSQEDAALLSQSPTTSSKLDSVPLASIDLDSGSSTPPEETFISAISQAFPYFAYASAPTSSEPFGTIMMQEKLGPESFGLLPQLQEWGRCPLARKKQLFLPRAFVEMFFPPIKTIAVSKTETPQTIEVEFKDSSPEKKVNLSGYDLKFIYKKKIVLEISKNSMKFTNCKIEYGWLPKLSVQSFSINELGTINILLPLGYSQDVELQEAFENYLRILWASPD